MKVWQTTITDRANFDRVEFEGMFASREAAETYAQGLLPELIERDKHHGLGNTFNVSIVEWRVIQ